MSEQRKKRNDYRTESHLTLRGFLVNAYPAGLDYKTSITSRHDQIHETARHKGGPFVFMDAGKPAMCHKFLDELAGIPHVTFRKAIDKAEELDPMAIKVLKWHQKKFKESRHKFAFDMGMAENTLSKVLHRAVAMVREQLPEDARWTVESIERTLNEPLDEAA